LKLGVIADPVHCLIDRIDDNVWPVDDAVVDKTGLNGNFDLKFEWSPQHLNPPPPPQQSRLPEPGATFLQDLNEQLGLTLESQTGPVEVFVIDHVEKPSEN
jgi:uncharacterized protein (TIGR03435 family)